MIYLSTAFGLTPGGSSTVHIYIQTTQITTNLEECRLCPVSVSFTLAFALQLGKSTEKPQSGWLKSASIHITHYQNTHTLQNNIKPPQYKLKQT